MHVNMLSYKLIRALLQCIEVVHVYAKVVHQFDERILTACYSYVNYMIK